MSSPLASNSPSTPTFHEKIAATRWGTYISERERAAILEAHDLSGRPGTVIDIGCEGGRWSSLLARRGWHPICIDVDAEAVETCANRLPDAECICLDEDYDRLPADTEAVDLVLCIEVPPVIYSDWFLSEIRRVLRPGGLAVTVFWNRGSLRGRFAARRAQLQGTYDYYPQRYVDWIGQAASKGFEVEYEEGFCWGPFSRTSDSILVKPAVFLESLAGLRRWIRYAPWIVTILRRVG